MPCSGTLPFLNPGFAPAAYSRRSIIIAYPELNIKPIVANVPIPCYSIGMEKLLEIKDVRQRSEEGYRRWFSNDSFDLILWYKDSGEEIKGLQFCYGKPYAERAFTWEKSYRSSHYISEKTDLGSSAGILWGDAGRIPQGEIENFKETSSDIGEELETLVLKKIAEYNAVHAEEKSILDYLDL